MSKLRPECGTVTDGTPALPNDTVLFLVAQSVARRRELICGRLHDGKGRHCAMGAFWTDNPKAVVNTDILDEIAAVNDSVPEHYTPQQRWKTVNSWLRLKMRSLGVKRP